MMADRKFRGLTASTKLLVAVGTTVGLLSCGGGGGGGAGSGVPVGPPTTSTTPAAVSDGIEITGAVAKGGIIGEKTGKILCFFSKQTEIPHDMIPRIGQGDTATTVDIDQNGGYGCKAPPDTKMVAASIIIQPLSIPGPAAVMRDEETGQNVEVPQGFLMRAVADITGTAKKAIKLNVTPLSEASAALAAKSGGLTIRLVNLANSGVSNLVGLDILGTKPVQSSDSAALASATTAEIRMSKINASISRMAANDSMGCGVKDSFGQVIDCTKNNWAKEFSFDNAGATPKVVLSNQGYQTTFQNLVSSRVKAIGEPAVELLQSAKTNVTSAFAKVIDAIDGASRSGTFQNEFDDLRKSTAGQYYHLAVMSEIVYSTDWVNAKKSGLTLTTETPNPTRLYGSRYRFDGEYSVLDWGQVPGLSALEAEAADLQWNAFVSKDGQEIVFAYRGTEMTNGWDWITNLKTLSCSPGRNNQYQVALRQFEAVLATPKYRFVNEKNGAKKRVVLTGHSLGGGLANFVGLVHDLDVYEVVTFNAAPICGGLAADLLPANSLQSTKFRDIRIEDEALFDVVVSANRAIPQAIVGGKLVAGALAFPGSGPVWFPTPVSKSVLYADDNHGEGIVLFVMKSGFDLCVADAKCKEKIPAAKPSAATLQQPKPTIATFGATALSSIAPYRPSIPVTGTNLSSINRIEWACTMPNGSACTGSPYVWTSSNWAGKAVFDGDALLTLNPQLLAGGDPVGVFSWTVTFSAFDGTSAAKAFTVTNTPVGATAGIVVSQINSVQFASGTTTIVTASKPFTPSIVVSGQNLASVVGIEWRWSGAATGGASWAKTDANWGSKVSLGIDGKLTLAPTVVESNPSWSGTAIWIGTLREAAGSSRNITFSVTYQPPVVQVPTCVSPKVLINGVCVASLAQSQPDLVPQAIAIPNASVAAGGSVTINYNVANIGSGASPTSTTRVQVVGPSGTIYTQPETTTSAIAAGAQVSASQTISMAGAPAGTYTVYVMVDFPRTANQSNINNDVSAGQVFTVAAPVPIVPTISGVTPTAMVGSSSTQTLTISGSFQSGNYVQFNWGVGAGAGVWTTSSQPMTLSSSSISIPMLPGLVNDTIRLRVCNSAGTCAVNNPSIAVSAPAPVVPIVPTVTGVTPPAMVGSSTTQTVTINGSFQSGNYVQFNWGVGTGAGVWTTSSQAMTLSSSSISIPMLPGLANDTIRLRVCNSAGSCSANNPSIEVTAPAPVVPTVTGVTPTAMVGSSTTQTVTISGSFQSGNYVQFNWGVGTGAGVWTTSSQAMTLSSSSISIPMLPGLVNDTIRVRVCNSAGSCSANNPNIGVTAPAPVVPTVSNINPNPVPKSASAQTITVFGANFASGATVTLVDTKAVQTFSGKATTFTNSGQLSFSANFTATAASWTVKVVNPNGQTSGAFNFNVQ